MTRTQLSALVTGGVLAMVAYGLGAVLGIAAWTTWPVVIVTLLMVFALGLSSAPDRGAGLMLEGYLRMLWASLPFTSSVSSSRRRPGRSRERIVVRMQLHAAPRHGEGR
ncbi:hypothetical protein KL864_16785 [Mycolicibacterium goodii]|uniref:hypothetical protein n=1 Tax=Mycolicibacterium goodii TaxID=134601 RepID=UPI0011153219|nr:hypothetical protein [Mycolicibacterium goodii]MBU8817559.1 hypothetical protein [Mycolicibacterium goodii]